MTDLIHKNEVYRLVAGASMYEDDFERRLLRHGGSLFPIGKLVLFKRDVCGDGRTCRGDLALIDHEYRRWWIIEVELGIHALGSHVEPQVRTLRDGRFDEGHVEALVTALPECDAARVATMVLAGEPPGVHVLVNEQKAGWAARLAQLDVTLGVVEVFRARSGREILRVTGDRLELASDMISRCNRHDGLPNALVVEAPGGLLVPPGDTVEVVVEGGTSLWKRIDAGNRVWLMPVGRSPLPEARNSFALRRHGGDRYQLVWDS